MTKKRATDGSIVWKCKCDCGNFCEATSVILNNGIKKSCGCMFLEFYEKTGKRYKEISGAFWCSYRNHAKSSGREFSITLKEAWEIWEKQHGRCALSGIKLYFSQMPAVKNKRTQTASMDRIDSSKDYFKENIQWVHKEINMMKQAHTDEDFIKWCSIVSEYQKKKLTREEK